MLDLGERHWLQILADHDGGTAEPMVLGPAGDRRRARPGDGAAEALIATLAGVDGAVSRGRFTLRSWTKRTAVGERPVGVDQTNESVIVGDAAVVKWSRRLHPGPHPAPRRIAVLRARGFAGMPQPWGQLTWRAPDGCETLVASVDEYLPGAADGWTWAVDAFTAAARARGREPAVSAATDVGHLVAELHAALADTASTASAADARRWRADARAAVEAACAVGDSAGAALLRDRRHDVETAVDGLGELAGTPVIEGHGDLHVGQILRSAGGFHVTDFDGNPVLPAEQRMAPIPAAADVAGMVQSLAHVAVVAARHADLDPAAVAAVDSAVRAAFLGAYTSRLAGLGRAALYVPEALYPFRVQQVLREILYAAQYLPRWMYVPDAALPALLAERTPA